MSLRTVTQAGRSADLGGRGLRASRDANGGTLGGFFDVLAWREPGEVRFDEVKAGPDRIKPIQLRFVELALLFPRLQEFRIIEVAGPLLRVLLS